MEDDSLEIGIETGSQDELLHVGVEQEDPALRDQGKLAARERLGISGEVRGGQTLVPQANRSYDYRRYINISFAYLRHL